MDVPAYDPEGAKKLLEEAGFGEADYEKAWVKLPVGPLTMAFPNTKGRRRSAKLHDLHHLRINKEGIMDINFGICFFVMDRIFGTFNSKGEKFSNENHAIALGRYSFIQE